jgi:hypothetical protein
MIDYHGRRSCLALTFDHEMSTNFPYRSSIWDHRKGEIDLETRHYVVRQNAFAGELGVKLTYFLVASALEANDTSYLQEAVAAGHEIGNHTYSHVNVTATEIGDLRGAYAARPWLVGARDVATVIRDEIAGAHQLIESMLGVRPQGFRTPYGFTDGLAQQPWLRQMLRDDGFGYVSTRYFGWDIWDERLAQSGIDDARLLADLRQAQPYRYADGLLELPIVTPTDCHVFRPWRWPVERWIAIVKRLIDLAYEHGLMVNLCCHPSILAACDPEFLTIRIAVEHARSKADGVWIATLSEVASLYESEF